jgi:hypothetical protein
MATVLKSFDAFTIGYAARADNNSSVRPALINCFQQGTLVGQLQFFPDNVALTTGGSLGGGGSTLIMFFKRQHFADILAILRGGQPLVLFFDADLQHGFLLATLDSVVDLVPPEPLETE